MNTVDHGCSCCFTSSNCVGGQSATEIGVTTAVAAADSDFHQNRKTITTTADILKYRHVISAKFATCVYSFFIRLYILFVPLKFSITTKS